MCIFFYSFCSICTCPFTPTYTRISLLMLEIRAGRQSRLFIYVSRHRQWNVSTNFSDNPSRGSRAASFVRRTEESNTLLRLDNAPKHESNFGPVFLHVTIFFTKVACSHTTQLQRTDVNLPTLRFLYKATAS